MTGLALTAILGIPNWLDAVVRVVIIVLVMTLTELALTYLERKVIARRLTEAKQQVPHFYLSMNIEIDALLTVVHEIGATVGEPTPQIDALLQHIPNQGARLAGCILVADSSHCA